jgi:hypothetical protein
MMRKSASVKGETFKIKNLIVNGIFLCEFLQNVVQRSSRFLVVAR